MRKCRAARKRETVRAAAHVGHDDILRPHVDHLGRSKLDWPGTLGLPLRLLSPWLGYVRVMSGVSPVMGGVLPVRRGG